MRSSRPSRTPCAGTRTTGTLELDPAGVTVVTALELEARAVRRRVPAVRVVCAGVGLEGLHGRGETAPRVQTPLVLSVGLAGGLDPGLEPGTVVIPERMAGPDGHILVTDPVWTGALRAAARRLHLPTQGGALVTTASVVTGATRAGLASRGYVAADMESTAIAALAPAVAAVRVILDTPSHEISALWRQPFRAAVRPHLWPQGVWLMRVAPRFAMRAADVLAEALRGQVLERDVHAEI